MILIWSGYGLLVFLIVFINSLIAQLITMKISGQEDFYETNHIPIGLSFLASAACIQVLQVYFNKLRQKKKGILFIKAAVVARQHHSFLFIRFQHWPFVLILIGAGVIIVQLVKNG